MNGYGKAAINILVRAPISAVMSGLVIKCYWNWFITGLFTEIQMPLLNAIALGFFASFLFIRVPELVIIDAWTRSLPEDGKYLLEFIFWAIITLVMWPIFLLQGYILHLFV